MAFYITKASGEKELFDIEKFRRSLKRSGADDELINTIAKQIESMKNLRTTKEIYHFAIEQLHKQYPVIAARYNIKQAIMALGPSGFTFEKFIGELFKDQGYTIQEDQMVQGFCVQHEIDIIAHKENKNVMVECKFHNQQGLACDVKVTLYSKARFDDIDKKWKQHPKENEQIHKTLIATNTRFTTEAIDYAQCVGLDLLGWSYPEGNSLPDLIKKYKLHPITALVSLTNKEKNALIQHGFVLCRDAHQYAKVLEQLHFPKEQVQRLIKEAEQVCQVE